MVRVTFTITLLEAKSQSESFPGIVIYIHYKHNRSKRHLMLMYVIIVVHEEYIYSTRDQ